MKLPIIGVMGSGKEEYAELSAEIGSTIAKLGYNLLTGGGLGVMTAVARAFMGVSNRKGQSIGIIPMERNPQEGFISRQGYPNPYVEVPIYVPLGIPTAHDDFRITRNYVNILTSNVVIALPGSIGTRNEVALCLRLNKPVILYGVSGFFRDMPEEIPRTNHITEIVEFIKNSLALEKEVLG
ncbi:MAG: LOG family protein [Proteobacteria bacterium]|nr:LOG family protein [Pseudomonadota bacterium]